MKVLAAEKFVEPITDYSYSPFRLMDAIAAKLYLTLNGEVVKTTMGLRIGLDWTEDDDRKPEAFKKTLTFADQPPTEKKHKAIILRAESLIDHLDTIAKKQGFSPEHLTITDESLFTRDLPDNVMNIAIKRTDEHLYGERLGFTDDNMGEVIRNGREIIWDSISRGDYGNYKPHRVGSVHGGEKKKRK